MHSPNTEISNFKKETTIPKPLINVKFQKLPSLQHLLLWLREVWGTWTVQGRTPQAVTSAPKHPQNLPVLPKSL